MKRLILLFLFNWCSVTAQNLVPNYSFELMTNSTCNVGSLNSSQFWYSPTLASPDYFNQCADTVLGFEYWRIPYTHFGFQYPRTGNGFAGFSPFIKTTSIYYNYQEYLQVQLNQELFSGKKYCIEFYVNMADSSNFAIDDIGLYLSNTAVGNMASWEYLPFTPQIESPQGNYISDTINWVRILGEYIAVGGEKFITIGCFKNYIQIDTLFIPGNQTSSWPFSYYFVDDVSVVFCDTVYKAEAGRDTAICPGSGVTIGTHDFGDYTYEWQPVKGLNDTHSPTPYATPTETTTYYLTVHDFMDTVTVDSITVRVLDCDTMNWTIPNAFTPNGDGKNDIFMPHGKYIRNVEGKIINRWGMEIYSWNGANTGWDGTTKHGDKVDPGVFYYIIKIEFENGEEISKAGTVHVIATE